MRIEKIELEKHFEVLGSENRHPCLTMYLPDNTFLDRKRKRPAVIICPGGAYIDLSDRESEPIALYFMSRGFAAFVLNYSTSPYHFPAQLLEGMASVAYLRRHAQEICILEDKILICGFSAGGHLAGSVGILGKCKEYLCALSAQWEECRPDGMILCYPVTDHDIHSEKINCFDFLTGKESSETAREKASLSRHVSADTPPAFIWHTLKDVTVPVKSSLILALTMEEKGVPVELHVFSGGPHGLSLCNYLTASDDTPQYLNEGVGQWKVLLENWLKETFAMKM